MKNAAIHGRLRNVWMWLHLILPFLSLCSLQAEIKLDVLKSRTTVYTNVIVTSKTKTDIYIIHATGICNLRLAELPPETIYQLAHPNSPYNASEASSTEEEDSTASDETSQPASASEQFNAQLSSQLLKLRSVGRTLILAFLAVSLLVYLFLCYCFSLICRKAGTEPGILVWLPILQLLPLLRAADMSPLWIVAWFLPILNLVAHVTWCINITKARGKSFWVAILLMLPLTNLIALLYLAFSNGTSSKDEPIRIEPLVLETN